MGVSTVCSIVTLLNSLGQPQDWVRASANGHLGSAPQNFQPKWVVPHARMDSDPPGPKTHEPSPSEDF